jgi:hypothetical protein
VHEQLNLKQEGDNELKRKAGKTEQKTYLVLLQTICARLLRATLLLSNFLLLLLLVSHVIFPSCFQNTSLLSLSACFLSRFSWVSVGEGKPISGMGVLEINLKVPVVCLFFFLFGFFRLSLSIFFLVLVPLSFLSSSLFPGSFPPSFFSEVARPLLL